jgi:hypothetical protein
MTGGYGVGTVMVDADAGSAGDRQDAATEIDRDQLNQGSADLYFVIVTVPHPSRKIAFPPKGLW